MRKYKIPKEDRKAWLKALESGEYAQGTDALYSEEENAYCCLGVFGKIKNISDIKLLNVNMPSHLYPEDQVLYPPCLLGIGYRSFARNLARMNDRGTSFKKIAKYIRKHTVGV